MQLFSKLIVILLILSFNNPIFAQSKSENAAFEIFNKKRLVLSGSIGINFVNAKLANNPLGSYDLPIFNDAPDPGFNVNLLANLKLNKTFDLRFSPGVAFYNRQIEHTAYYGYGNNAKAYNKLNLGVAFLEFPLDIVYKMPVHKNKRFIVGIGGKFSYDLAWENNPIELERIIYKNANDVQLEAFVGYQIFASKIVVTPEIKFSKGFGRIFTYQNKAVLTDTYFNEIPTVFSFALGFSFN